MQLSGRTRVSLSIMEARKQHGSAERCAKMRSNMGVWVAIGIAIGAGVGVALHNIALGVGLGVGVGAALGAMASRRKS